MIVATARRLAEAEGWEAVAARRLAEQVEYSQPVLYSHFANKDAIVAALAVEGFAELAEALEAARTAAGDRAPEAVAGVVTAYADFADEKPALYEAMFTRTTGLPFAQPEAPAPLHAAFEALRDTLRAVAGDRDLGLLTEVAWGALHGLVTLTRDGRLPPETRSHRLTLLTDLLLPVAPVES